MTGSSRHDAASLTRALGERAVGLGFVHHGVAAADRLGAEAEHLASFLAAGHHADMEWLAETAAVRVDPRDERFLPTARAVFVVAVPLSAAAAGVGVPLGDAEVARVARYAWGRDYHNALGKRLRKLVKWLRAEGHDARLSVDAQPVMERAWAERSGLGFIGKNACLIVPGVGSHVMLGAVVTSAPLVASAPNEFSGCGRCTRCLDACPTQAFVAPHQLDAGRCLSYLTIEREGRIEESLREDQGEWLFGCDVCQDVCPFNRARGQSSPLQGELGPDEARWSIGVETVLRFSDEDYRAWSRGSPLARPGRESLARNLAYVLGNRGGRRHLPILAERAERDESSVVREAARWAARRIEERDEG